MKFAVLALALTSIAAPSTAQDTGHPIWGHQLDLPAGISEKERVERTADVACDMVLTTEKSQKNLDTQRDAAVAALGNAIDRGDVEGVKKFSRMLGSVMAEDREVALKRGYAAATCETYMKMEEQLASK